MLPPITINNNLDQNFDFDNIKKTAEDLKSRKKQIYIDVDYNSENLGNYT